MVVEDIVNKNHSITDHTTITVEWLLNSLRKNDEEFKKLHGTRAVKEVTANDVSKGKGFASEILKCTLTFVDSKDFSNVYTTILKIPGLESIKTANAESGNKHEIVEDKALKDLAFVHHSECEFYTEIAPILNIQNIPKVYKTQEWIIGKSDGCIHMEDLSLRGKTCNYFESVNLTKVKAVIRELAKIHKNVLISDPKKWERDYSTNQLRFADTAAKMWPMHEPFLAMSKRETEFRPLIEKYKKFAENQDFFKYAATQAHKDLGLKSVIIHGDLHFGNIMWTLDSQGDIQNEIAALVDWQIMHEGSPMYDLARFLCLSADGVVRRQAEDFAVDYYLECLLKEFGGDSTKIPYTSENLKKAYNFSFLTQVFVLAGVALFFLSTLEATNQSCKDACFDSTVLKAIHGFEDADRLLQNEMKEYFEKYGL